MKKPKLVVSLVFSAMLAGCHDGHSQPTASAPEPSSAAAAEPSSRDAVTPSGLTEPRAELETTRGAIVIYLAVEEAPATVLRFVRYVKGGMYEGTIFHRVVAGSMIQGGGYTPDMKPREIPSSVNVPGTWQSGMSNERGTIALIRSAVGAGVPTAQFYINLADNLELDSTEYRGTFAVFGRVLEGMDAVEAIAQSPVGTHPDYAGGRSEVVPTEPIVIRSVTLRDVPHEERLVELISQSGTALVQQDIDEVTERIESETGRPAVRTDTGLRYVVTAEGTGATPLQTDTVEFHYHGTLPDGTVFESTRDTEPAVREVEALIPGLIEAFMGMKEHERRMLIVPPDLAFGETGVPGRIPPDTVTIFDVELLSVR
ncbi:MAG: peptidylprolyl isomerase [Phycisphaerae bacterium]